MRRHTWIAIAALLAALPSPGQIIQRMERDVAAAQKLQAPLEKAQLLALDELKKIALSSRFPRDLRSEESGILRRTALRLSQGDYVTARKDWETALGKMKEREFAPDVDALIHGVLKQAYLEKDVNFQPLAAAVQFREQQREAVYRERTGLERMKSAFDEGKASGDLRIQPLILADEYAIGVRPVQRAEPLTATAESVSSELQKIVVLCNAADDSVQQAVVDLQQALDGQILQTMSNVSKMLRDTAKAIVGNIKA